MRSESAANIALAECSAVRATIGRNFATPGPRREYRRPSWLARTLAALFTR